MSCFWLVANPAFAAEAIVECAADAWLAVQSSNTAKVHGTGPELVLNDERKWILLGFRTAGIAGWQIQSASLMLHVRSGRPPAKVEMALHTDDWSESATSLRFSPPKLAVPFAVLEGKDGWIEIRVAPQFVEAIAAGRARGLVLAGRGSKQYCIISSRKSNGFAPYLVVEGARLDR